MIFNTALYIDKLTKHRRNLHRIPELNRDLPKTKSYLLSVLEKLDCTLTFVCECGICVFFDRGKPDTYGFRADMDGLPVQEINEVSYASIHNGKMHACGHDAHMAMVLTFGEYVDTRKDLNHNVLLIFQPAEEMLGGAEEICKTGILEKYNVTRVFGIHMWPFLDAGIISSKSGAFMPKSAEIHVDIYGKTAHGTSPYIGNDALYIAADYIKRTYEAHSKVPGAIHRFPEGIGDLKYIQADAPEEKTLIHFGKITSGYARNVVSDHSFLLGTVRAYYEDNFDMVISILQDNLNKIEDEYKCKTKLWHSNGYPPVVNHAELYEEIRPKLIQLPHGYEEMELPLVISEDYSFYGFYAPSVFFVLGTGTGIPLHSTNFDFDEKILLSGLELYMTLID